MTMPPNCTLLACDMDTSVANLSTSEADASEQGVLEANASFHVAGKSDDQVVCLVLLEMGLAFFGILLNLLVVTTVRHHDSLQAATTNLLLLNLCFSNLIISFLVKPISAIYGGYSISTQSWEVSLVFCSLYTMTYRTTWCILPFTILSLSWLLIIKGCEHRFNLRQGSQPTQSLSPSPRPSSSPSHSPISSHSPYYPGTLSPAPAPLSPETKKRLAELSEDLTMKQKITLIAIWLASAFYGVATCFPEKIFGIELFLGSELEKMLVAREEGVASCTVKSGLNDFLDYISITVCFLLPISLGPLPLAILYPFMEIKAEERKEVPSLKQISLLTTTFFLSYFLHMILSETIQLEGFIFLAVKNLAGFLFLLIVPIIVICTQKDIRRGMRPLFQSKVICPDPDLEEEDLQAPDGK